MKQLYIVFGITIFFSFFFKRTLGEWKDALESEHLETNEPLRDLSSKGKCLDLDQSGSKEPEISFPETQPSSRLGEKIDQILRMNWDRKGERKRRWSDLSEWQEEEFQSKAEIPEKSLVSTSEDILFWRDDRANVYPLIRECNMVFSVL